MTNKTCLILAHLKAHGSITQAFAMHEYGVMRLADCIWRLKKQGHPIDTEMVDGKDKYGNSVRYARYIYKGEIDEF